MTANDWLKCREKLKDVKIMKSYIHKVQYYETDRMGFTHHSNYIRWMEEARIDFLSQLGWDYDRLESEGIVSPVTEISCSYKKSTTFSEEIAITVFVEKLGGVRLNLGYLMENQQGDVVCEAYSEHVFTDETGRILRLKKELPELYNVLEKELERQEKQQAVN